MRSWSARSSRWQRDGHRAPLPVSLVNGTDDDDDKKKMRRRSPSRSRQRTVQLASITAIICMLAFMLLYSRHRGFSAPVDDDDDLYPRNRTQASVNHRFMDEEDDAEDQKISSDSKHSVSIKKLGQDISPYDFTIPRGANGRHVKLISFGRNYGRVVLPKTQMVKQHSTEVLGEAAFNLAILRMPEDAEWPFVGIARAPLNHIKHDTIPGAQSPVELNSLLGFGLNLTSSGTFEVISKATFLQLSMRPAYNCGIYAIYQGPEDPRPYWSDAGLPMMMIGMPSLAGPGHCRGIGMVHDLRSAWPELTSVLAGSKIVPRFRAGAHGDDLVELTRIGAGWQEKNWMPFFPGPKPDSKQIMPYIHYSSHPEEVLEPPQRSYRRTQDEFSTYQYSMQRNPASDSSACIVSRHPYVFDSVHGATPLYRLTMCDRGTCVPDKQNTVLVALNHYLMEADKNGARMYTRYFAFWSTANPITPVALGPMFQYRGADSGQMIYALSMAFVPSKSNATNSTIIAQSGAQNQTALGAMHGFLDDRVFVSVGVGDAGMASIELSVKDELLRGLQSCSANHFPSALRAWVIDDL